VKGIEGDVTQAKLAEDIGTSAPYVSRLIRNNEKIVNKTFLQLMERLGYDVELTYVKREERSE
jgi:plasmid maintenance system antidote protein VapI